MRTLAQYRSCLRVNKLKLDDELETQAELQEEIAREVSRLAGRADLAKDELARVEARLAVDFKTQEGPRKLTVDDIAGGVRRHRDRINAWDRWQAAVSEAREWSDLLDAWKTRGFNLRPLADLYASDYYSVTQTSLSGSTLSNLERLAPDREALRGASRRDDPPVRRRRTLNA